MIERRRILAVILARGGSKGLPRKNLADLGGKPLIAWSIAAAKSSRYIDRVVLSSDDDEIIDVARKSGCEVPFRRPAALATDTANSVDVALHALDALGEDYELLVLLQPTSPLRIAADIDGCIELRERSGAPVCVSVTESDHPPYWHFRLDGAQRMHPIAAVPCDTRRQDLPPTVQLNGAVYVAETVWLRGARAFVTEETVGYRMPRERSVDIDDALDLALARAVLASPPIVA